MHFSQCLQFCCLQKEYVNCQIFPYLRPRWEADLQEKTINLPELFNNVGVQKEFIVIFQNIKTIFDQQKTIK